MAKWRKKPIVVDAVQMPADGQVWDNLHKIYIPYTAGDWVITGIKGEHYAVKREVFEETYEKEPE